LKGDTLAVNHAFEVVIEADKSIGALKQVIKAKNAQTFANVDTKDIKLWKVEIPDDHYSELAKPALQDQLLATRDVGDYWSAPPKRHIHVIVEPPVSVGRLTVEKAFPDGMYLTQRMHFFLRWVDRRFVIC